MIAKTDLVPEPEAVRYAWRNWVKGTLLDTNMLPASSCRTDSWKDATVVGINPSGNLPGGYPNSYREVEPLPSCPPKRNTKED